MTMRIPHHGSLAVLVLAVACAVVTPVLAQTPLTISADRPSATASSGAEGLAEVARRLAGIGTDEHVEVDFEGKLDGHDAVALYVDRSGASCESGTEVLIVARPGGAPAIGQIEDDSCFSRPIVGKERSLQSDGLEDALVVRTEVSPTMDGQLWRFTARDGLKLVGSLKFAPQPGTAMSPASTSAMRYGFELYRNAEFLDRFRGLTGPDAISIMRATSTSEPVHRSTDGRFVVAPGCMPHNCRDEAGMLVVDAQTSAIFVAYKPEGRPIRVYPAVSTWPNPARQALKAWAAPWM